MMARLLKTGFVLAFSLQVGGCGGSDPEPDLIQSYRTSACDGFEANGQTLFSPVRLPPLDYCDAEVLHWHYDAKTGQLSLLDARILLNCCGEHSMQIEQLEGETLVTERDAPETLPDGSEARCGCMCVFDFGVEAQPVPGGLIHLRIVREVTDWPEASITVWVGDLDLSQGSGFEVINDIPEQNWCENP